ncbi:MAG TPA: hypothetical protein PLQ78_08560, partial [Flavipsychrobacter sp.]|nr:hypothetical protein [Flavipsychrobacter sp.]
MKRKLIVMGIVLMMTAIRINAQPSPFQIMVGELRQLFSNISNPNPSVSFFYDLSPHIVDSAYFHHYVDLDTNNASNWFNLYKEMYYMAYDTTLYLKSDTVYQRALSKIQSDTIPLGIIDWDFNLLIPAALTTGNYFTFDTINNLLYDIPGAPSPYTVQTTFAGSTFRETYPFTNPVFIIDPHYFFKDAHKLYTQNEGILKIDFDDGTGWHIFTESTIEHYQASYGSGGRKTIQYGFFPNLSSSTPTRYAVSALLITSNLPLITPGATEDYDGITVSYYPPEDDCFQNLNRKYVIYLEGLDPREDRHGGQIYNEMIVDPELTQLKNFGYTFVVVDWKNSRNLIENNAMYVVDLIEKLKCSTGPEQEPPQPFVVIGESMGGLVARYALCYMEQPSYFTTCPNTDPGVPHHTRLLITIDAPHQGANIPIGLQYMYHYGVAGTLSAIGFSPWALGQFAVEFNAMNGSARQMLKYHVSTDPFIATPASTSYITEDPLKTLFDLDLESLGNYPVNCKTVALSNGSWLGAHQPTAWDSTIARQPNDFILDIESETYIKVLGIKILGTKLDLEVRTNPAGSGDAFTSTVGVSHWKIKLKWFGVKLQWWTDYTMGVDKDVMGVEPYCVMPGSTPGVPDDPFIPAPPFHPFNLLDFFGFQVQSGNGNLNITGYVGDPLFGNANLSFNAYSDGASFDFIPTYSSFDYENVNSFDLDHQILNEPIADILNETPFDVVYTNPTERNWAHLTEQNPALGVCQTCIDLVTNSAPGANLVHSRLLNREIGDDSLWLENFPTNYITAIECELDMMVNERNIYYNYDGQASSIDPYFIGSPNLNPPFDDFGGAIVVSKQDPMGFNINQELLSNGNLWQNPFQPPLYGTYNWNQGSMQICCINYNFRPTGTIGVATTSTNKAGFMQMYPNPVKDNLTIAYQMKSKDKVTITVYDV